MLDPKIDKKIDRKSLFHYLENGYSPVDSSLIKDVKKLAPGHSLTFKIISGEIVIDKEIELNVELDGQPVTIKLSELPVQCPILSVRKIVKRGNMVVFPYQGGCIVHKATGRKINFVDRDGVS